MKKEKKKTMFRLARIERVSKFYDKQSRIVQEKWEYFYPMDTVDQLPSAIGFCVDEIIDSD